MDKEELFQARTNPDFLKYLEETKQNSIKEKNISLMYETLDSMLVLNLDEDLINELYTELLNVSFENVEKIINENKKLKFEGDDFLYTRALYEYAIEKWSNNNFTGAKELFFLILNLIQDEVLEKSLKILIIFLYLEIDFDEFYDKKIDLDKSSDDKYLYFITNFNFNQDEYLKDNKEILKNEYENLKHLIQDKK